MYEWENKEFVSIYCDKETANRIKEMTSDKEKEKEMFEFLIKNFK